MGNTGDGKYWRWAVLAMGNTDDGQNCDDGHHLTMGTPHPRRVSLLMIDIDDGQYSRDGYHRRWVILAMGFTVDGPCQTRWATLTMGITDDGHDTRHDGHHVTMGITFSNGYH